MNDIKMIITEQLQRVQMILHRTNFYNGTSDRQTRNPRIGQGRILALLKMKPEMSQRDITYLLGMSKQAVAQALEKLEKSACIIREPSAEDKRISIIKLTEAGMESADNDERERESSCMLDCLNDEELQNLNDYLERMIKGYEDQHPNENFVDRRNAMERFMSRYGGSACKGYKGCNESQGGAAGNPCRNERCGGGFGERKRHCGSIDRKEEENENK